MTDRAKVKSRISLSTTEGAEH